MSELTAVISPEPHDGQAVALLLHGYGSSEDDLAGLARTEAWLPSHSTLTRRTYPGLAHAINADEAADVREFVHHGSQRGRKDSRTQKRRPTFAIDPPLRATATTSRRKSADTGRHELIPPAGTSSSYAEMVLSRAPRRPSQCR